MKGCTSTPRSTETTRSGGRGCPRKCTFGFVLDDWLREAAAALDVKADAGVLTEDAVTVLLELARDAAHGVARPAAPLGTFVLGLALGSSGGGIDDLRRFARRLADLAERWEADPSPS